MCDFRTDAEPFERESSGRRLNGAGEAARRHRREETGTRGHEKKIWAHACQILFDFDFRVTRRGEREADTLYTPATLRSGESVLARTGSVLRRGLVFVPTDLLDTSTQCRLSRSLLETSQHIHHARHV